MNLTHEGLTLWYATPDAPAPLDEVVRRDGAAIAVGVCPANPTNAVHVRYRVDGGIVQTAPGRELHTDHERGVQYFIADLPLLPIGRVVEYCPVLSCGGRQVPGPPMAQRFSSKFLLADVAPRAATAPTRPSVGPRWPLPELTFVSAITLHMNQPQFIGETPEGVRVNFYVKDGTAVGPLVNGSVFPGSSDHMIIRPDGIGVIRVRAVICTNDGATLEVEEGGSIDFGDDGYRQALTGSLPSQSGFVVCLRVLTAHPRYRWLNRVKCLGAGRTGLDELVVEHDVFAVKGRAL